MIQLVINSTEPLIFRDGRPFGDFGTVTGGVLRWPLPSTIAGMVRTRIGVNHASDFFWKKDRAERTNNIAAILKIGVRWTLPVWKPHGGQWRYLFPRPADALLMNVPDTSGVYTLHRFTLQKGDPSFGHDLPWKNWLLPVSDQRDKPAADAPDFWHQAAFLQWLMLEPMQENYSHQELGFSLPELEVRMHTSIDPETGTVCKGQLFSSSGIRLEIPQGREQQCSTHGARGTYGIGVAIIDHEEADNPFGICLLGGERRTVFTDPLETPFPTCPTGFQSEKFLRLVLVTPGNFGGWAPDWLRPSKDVDETPWATLPDTDIQVRLVATHLSRWQAISGWDYDRRGPKAMRKLTPAGTVYVIEVKSPERSQELANHLWGRSIAQGLHNQDGYGVVCIGKVNFS